MSWSRTLLIAGMLLAAGCGFRPLYGGGEDSEVVAELADVQIATIEDRVGQMLHNALLDRLNPHGRPRHSRYTLNVAITVSKQELGLRFTEVATRAKLTIDTSFYLVDDRTGKLMVEGQARSTNSYNIPASEYARITSEKDATDRAVREVSDQIKTRLSVYFKERT